MEWIEATEGWLYDAYVKVKSNPHMQLLVQVTPYYHHPRVIEVRIHESATGLLNIYLPHGTSISRDTVTHWMPMPNPTGGAL